MVLNTKVLQYCQNRFTFTELRFSDGQSAIISEIGVNCANCILACKTWMRDTLYLSFWDFCVVKWQFSTRTMVMNCCAHSRRDRGRIRYRAFYVILSNCMSSLNRLSRTLVQMSLSNYGLTMNNYIISSISAKS